MISWAVWFSSFKLFAKDCITKLNFEVLILFALSLATKQDKQNC